MNTRRILAFFLIILALSIFSILYPALTGNITKTSNDYYPKETATLLRVVDGDTIHALVNGKDETIRLLGINTPEKNMPHANAAKEFLKQFENKTVSLQRDNEDTDKYKRKLRYVFYDNENLNIQIIRNGFANSYYTKGLIYEKEILLAEEKARKEELGIWQRSTEECSNCIILSNLDAVNESFIIKNICSFSCSLDGWFVKDAGRNIIYLSNLSADTVQRYESKNKDIWNNDGDKFFLFEDKGLLVIYYNY